MQQPSINEDQYGTYDVVVAGGGMAGITAAIAAARTGAKTMLIDKAGWLGGMGITGATGLHSFFNIFAAHEDVERTRVVGGIAQELVDRVESLGGGVGHVRMQRGGDFVSMLTPVEPETFKVAAALTCLESGVKLLLHTIVDEVRAANGHVGSIVVWNKAGRSVIRAKQYVDCTGDGDLAAYAGADFVHFKGDDHGSYSAGFTFRLCNIDLKKLKDDLERQGLIRQLAYAVKPFTNELDIVRLGMDLKPYHDRGEEGTPDGMLSSSLRPRELTYCNCINHGPNDGLDPDNLTDAETDLRQRMLSVANFFRKQFDGCAACYPAGSAPSAGQRRGRAIRCEYELTEKDCTEGRTFDDHIACFSFIDNRDYLVKDGGAYGIPYRALIPTKLDNVLIAGRMMTVDMVAHNSTRNTACCMICGQAAGTAAAMAAHEACAQRDVDIERLQRLLDLGSAILTPRPDPVGATQ